MTTLRAKVVRVTPALAQKWLEGNTQNRDLRQPNITKFERLLQSGEFMLTHQGIAFAPNGTLLDGQHRLWAIFNTGIAADMLVTEGADPATYAAIDTGINRSIADVVSMPPKKVAVAAVMARIANRNFGVPRNATLACVAALAEDVENLFAITQTERRGISGAPVKAGFVTFMILHEARRDWAADQYHQFVNGKLKETCDSLTSLYTRLTNGGRALQYEQSIDHYLRTYQSLRSPNVGRTQIKTTEAALLIARDALLARGVERFWRGDEAADSQRRRDLDRAAKYHNNQRPATSRP